MLIWHEPDGRGYEVNRSGKRGHVGHANPLNMDRRGRCRNLGSLIRPNLGPAATHLLHVAALPVHGTATSTFLMTHHHVGYTGHNWRGCGEE
jgi:hypothetical protein